MTKHNVKSEDPKPYLVELINNETEDQIIAEAQRILWGRMLRTSDILSSPKAAREYLLLSISHLEHEVFGVIYLTSQNQVIDCEELFRGTIDGASVYPREVLKAALQKNAAAVMFYHNHPSGVAEPSQQDHRITERLKEGLAMVDIRVLDHLIVGGDTIVSFVERGWL